MASNENGLLPILLSEQVVNDESIRCIGTAMFHSTEGGSLQEDHELAEKGMHRRVREIGGNFVINPQVDVVSGVGVTVSCIVGIRVEADIESQSED